MMTSLFSLFDPSLSILSMSWMISIFVVLFMPGMYWAINNYLCFYYKFLVFLKGEVDYILKSTFKGSYSFLGSIFLTLCLYNFMALFPFLFSLTSHMLVTLPFSYSFWFGIIVFSWFVSFKNFLAHLIPVGTPMGLMSFMVLVELMSNVIRPIALTFRLTANMVAGHLLMSLIGGSLIGLSFSFMVLGSVIQSLLVFMELGVSFIQSYVFMTLLLMYMSESS